MPFTQVGQTIALRAHAAGALAFWPGGAGLDSGDRGGKVGVVRARHPAPMPVYAAALAAMLFCLVVFGVLDAAIPFIYFQF